MTIHQSPVERCSQLRQQRLAPTTRLRLRSQVIDAADTAVGELLLANCQAERSATVTDAHLRLGRTLSRRALSRCRRCLVGKSLMLVIAIHARRRRRQRETAPEAMPIGPVSPVGWGKIPSVVHVPNSITTHRHLSACTQALVALGGYGRGSGFRSSRALGCSSRLQLRRLQYRRRGCWCSTGHCPLCR